MMRRLRLCLLLPVWLWLAGCAGKEPALQRQEAFVFGTRVEVTVVSEDPKAAREAIAVVLHEFDRLHRLLHAWKPSALKDVNDALAQGKSAVLNAELFELLQQAQAMSLACDGRFDPGIGRLIALWGFQSDDLPTAPPAESTLTEWRQRPVGIKDLVFEVAERHATSRSMNVRALRPGVALDLGGYAKGVALDRAAALLRARGQNHALINIGGNILALGHKGGADKKPWKVGIQHPRQPGALATLELRDGEAIGTSGDYQRFFEFGGKRYSHLLDPRSGEPVSHTQAVTVLISPYGPEDSDVGTRSDVWSKPLFLAGSTAWPALARRLDVPQVLRVDANGRIEVTPAMARRLQFIEESAPVTLRPE